MGSKPKDLRGKRFDRLVAQELHPERKRKYAQWVCRCDCGRTAVVVSQYLSSIKRDRKSCGCLKKEILLSGARMLNPHAKPFGERWPEVKGLIEAGNSTRRVAEILGLSYGSVTQIIRKARRLGEPELVYPIEKRKREEILKDAEMLEMPMPARWRELLELRLAGKKGRQVEFKLNVTRQRIYQILQAIRREYWKWKWEQSQKVKDGIQRGQ